MDHHGRILDIRSKMRLPYILSLVLVTLLSACSQESVTAQTEIVEKRLNEAFSQDSVMAGDIHSLIVYRDHKELYSGYFNGYTADSLNNVKSITKSIIGLLIGIALDQGHIKSLQEPALSYFNECDLTKEAQQEKQDITIEHLLMMQSGIAWNNRALIKDDWWFHYTPHCFLLSEFPMDTLPGREFSYNSAVAHLLSGILSRATGESTLSFARKHLFGPLDIEINSWAQDRSGEYYGNSELSLKPVDLIKIGQMLLHHGQYQGQSILAPKWVAALTEKAYDATPLMDYGYLWMTAKNDVPFFYFAGGSGGQHLFVVPDKDLIVVTTAHWDNARSTVEIMKLAVSLIKQL